MPCDNMNLKRELSIITKEAKRQGLWRVGRKNGEHSVNKKSKYGLKFLVHTVDLEMPGKNVYKKLVTDASAGKTEGYYTRELFRTMKDIDYGNIKSWHVMFDGYSPQDHQIRQKFRDFITTDPIMKRVLA